MDVDIPEAGFKMHMNDVAASIGLACLPLAMHAVRRSAENAAFYHDCIAKIPETEILSVPTGCTPSWWVYGFYSTYADALIEALQNAEIEGSHLWRRNDSYSCFGAYRTKDGLPGTEYVQANAVFIPNGWWVSNADRQRIVEVIKGFQTRG